MGEGSLQRYGRGWMQAVYGLEPQQVGVGRKGWGTSRDGVD